MSTTFDGDAPFIEHDGVAVTRILADLDELIFEYVDGSVHAVSYGAKVECGAAFTAVDDLHLVPGQWVTARDARFGAP